MSIEDFLTWIIIELKRRDWTNADLARRGELAESTVSRVLNKERLPRWDFCAGIARAFDLPPDRIFRLAGLLPSVPPHTADAREAADIVARLESPARRVVMDMLRASVGRIQPTYPPSPEEEWAGTEELPEELPEQVPQNEMPELTERELIAQGNVIPMTPDQWRATMQRLNSIWDKATDTMKPVIARRTEDMVKYFGGIRESCLEGGCGDEEAEE